jgi:uncharacterized protein
MLLDQPLAQRELVELVDFLSSDAAPEECMDIAMLHGFLTALAIGPSLVVPSEWLPVVWGDEDGPEFNSVDEARRILDLIMRLHNSIIRTLQDAPQKFLPILYEERTAEGRLEFSAEEWCEGFITGTQLDADGWEALVHDEENFSLLTPILALVDEEAMRELLAADQEEKATREKALALIPLAVAGMHDYWRSRRKEPLTRRTVDHPPVGRNRRVGRNEPCPCGSGKKFKKCCGSRED